MSHKHPPIAIVGMASLFPGATTLSAYWRNILDATDCISDVPDVHSWEAGAHHSDDPNAKDKTWCTRGGFLDNIPFDPIEFGIPPNMLESIDTTQLLSLIVAREALIDAGMHPDDTAWDRERVACILGITGTQEMAINLGARLFGPVWRKALSRCGVDDRVAEAVVADIGSHLPTWTEQSFPGLLGNVVTGRISNRFDLGGTNAVVDAACASSLAAVQYGLSDLIAGRSDVVITGGADALNDAFMFQCFTRTPAFSKRGDATPFDADSDGILIGEGIGMVVCKRLEDAERDGDRIYAVIKGLGSSSDGRFKSIYAPNPAGQAKCLRRAYESADVELSTVELIEAHGTGTRAGDVAEISGLKQVFGDTSEDGRWIQLGTVKSQIGHTKSTAGAAGLIKAALALHHRVLPPTAKVVEPNPKMGFEDSPFFLSPHARPWVRAGDHPRRAGVSAFGFGGTNFHAVLEEYGDPNVDRQLEPARSELLLFGADSAEGLLRQLGSLPDGLTFSHQARALTERFDASSPHRLAFTASELELSAMLDKARALVGRGPGSMGDHHYTVGATAGKLAFVFPGQGSQYVEMGRDLAVRWPTVRAVLDAADENFRLAGVPALSDVMFPPPYGDVDAQEALLRETRWAQPAIGAISAGMLALLTRFGLAPDAVAGHSYGELVALHAAGTLDLEGLFTASRARGNAMTMDGDRGTMAAISGDLDAIATALADHPEVVLANRNHPEQGVISGPVAAVEAAVNDLESKGLPGKVLSVSAAFHSALVADAAAPFAAELKDIAFKSPGTPVYGNTDAAPYKGRTATLRKRLAKQLQNPVDWVGSIRAMVDEGVRVFVEVGPKGVLSTLIRKTFADRDDIVVVSLDRHRHRMDGDQQLKNALAQLVTAGVTVDFAPLLAQPLPAPPLVGKSKATVGLSGANHKNESTRNPPMTPAIEAARAISTRPAPAASTSANVGNPTVPSKFPVATAAAPVSKNPPSTNAPRRPMSNDLTALLQSTRDTLLAFQSTQERTAAVHQQFLTATTAANASFNTLFATHARLVEIAATGSSSIAVPTLPSPPQLAASPAPMPTPAPVQVPLHAAAPSPAIRSAMSTEAAALVGSFLGQGTKTPAVASMNGLSGRVAVASDVPPLMDARSTPVQPSAARVAPAAPVGAGKDQVVSAMFAAVSDKTGYPLDMLELGMDLESDLGIDSIKRVEILSAVQDRVPGLPELDNDRLSALRTLAEVTDYLADAAGVSVPASPARPAAVTGAGKDQVVSAMFAAVSDKTGYPLDMLELGMDLESDLGIDSIKRVEILSAVQDRVPGLPELDNDRLSALRTLAEVTDYLADAAGVSVPASPAHPAAVTGAGKDQVVSAMFAAVSDKTGYPLDMLELGMDLESDLGIDSIKRVEILSAVQDRVPGLPELDNDRLSALRTLAEVTDYLADAAGIPITRTATANAEATLPFELARKTVRIVRCGPGRPADLRGTLLVTADLEGRAQELIAELRDRGVDAQLFEPDYTGVFTVPACEGLVHMGAIGATGQDLEARVKAAFTLANGTGEIPFFATVSNLGGDFGLQTCDEPMMGGLAGLPKTLSQEWAGRYLAIDIHPSTGASDLAQALTTVLDGVLEVGVRPDGLFRLHNADERMPHTTPRDVCAPGDLVVVSGGARGVTAAVVLELARRHQPDLLLLGRSAVAEQDPDWAQAVLDDGLQAAWIAHIKGQGEKPTPREMNRAIGSVRAAREVRSNLAKMTALGSHVRYASVDIRDATAVAEIVAASGKPVAGIIHGAGVLADKLVTAKTPEMFDRVWSTKIGGLQSLLSLVPTGDLKFAAFFASVAGRYGNIGQCDYAMANEVLTHTALKLSQAGVRAKSFAWGPWEAGMVTPALRRQFEERGLTVIPLDAGSRFALDELTHGGSAVEVVVEGPRPQHGTMERTLSLATLPFLADHSIDGLPVVPVALVLEWFADLANQVWPGPGGVTVEDLAVLKGIVLDGPTTATLEWEPLGHRQLSMMLTVDGRPRFRARVHRTHDEPARVFSGSNGLGASTFPDEPYGQWLFHGPALQGIREVRGFSDHGIVAQLDSSLPDSLGLGGLGWATGPLTVDSALQLMLLWVGKTMGTRALPCAIGSYRQFAPFSGPVDCHLHLDGVATHGRFHATFVNGSGTVVAELDGGEYAARP